VGKNLGGKIDGIKKIFVGKNFGGKSFGGKNLGEKIWGEKKKILWGEKIF